MSQRLTPRFLMYSVLVILVATGLSATVGFKRIESLIAGKVGSNEALHAHGRMAAALDEQMRSLLVLMERPLTPTEHDSLARTIVVFDAEIGAASQHARAEEFGLDAVRHSWSAYRALLQGALASDAQPAPRALAEALTALGTLRRATTSFVLRRKLDVSELRELIRRTARRYVLLAVGLTSLGMVVALLFHFRFTHFVRRPIEQVTAFLHAQATTHGGIGERLSVKGDAAIGELVRACNEHLESMERRGEEHWRELRDERRIATGLIEAVSGPAVLLTPAGEPLRANAAGRELLSSQRGNELRKELRRVVVDGIPAEEAPFVLEIRPVVAPGQFSGCLALLHPSPPDAAPEAPPES